MATPTTLEQLAQETANAAARHPGIPVRALAARVILRNKAHLAGRCALGTVRVDSLGRTVEGMARDLMARTGA